MPKMIEQWLLFKYVGGEFTPLSKQQAEKAAEIPGASAQDDWGTGIPEG